MRFKWFAFLFVVFTLVFVGVGWAQSFMQHALPGGQLVDAVAFENGDAVVLTYSVQAGNRVLNVSYYDVSGAMLQEAAWPVPEVPETLIMQVCGAHLQLFAGYPDAHAARYILALPRDATGGCFPRVFLPLVDK